MSRPQLRVPGHQASVALCCLCVLVLVAALIARPATAVMSGGESSRAESSDKDYAAGKRAFNAKDWQGVVDNMQKVVARRPWHDNALAYMGFAYRKLGRFDAALEHYDKALELNPRHRGALEYLGETYLELGRPEEAKAVLDRLEKVCKQIAVGFTNGGWKSGCEEWETLLERYDAYISTAK